MTTELKNHKKGYYHIENDLLDKWLRIIGPGAFIVYQELVRFCPGGLHIPFPTVTMIDWAAWVGMSYPSFSKHIDTLEEFGLIKIIRGRNKSRFVKESNKYEILPLPEVTPDDVEGVKPFPKGVRFGDQLRGERIFKTEEDSPYKESLGSEPQTSLGKGIKNVEDNNSTVKNNSTERSLSPKIEHFVKKFYAIQKEQFPNFIKQVSPTQIKQSCDAIDKLVRIDGFTLVQVFKAIVWATDDAFWARQILSITGLRSRSKNGSTKFQNILSQMGEDNKQPTKGSPPQQPEHSRFPADNSEYGNSMGIRDVDFK